MKIAMVVGAAALAAFCGAAQAGKTSAGPAAGNGIVGSTVVPGSSTVLNTPDTAPDGRRLRPGDAGVLMLQGQELINVRNALTATEGVTMDGSVIRVATVLADGGAATIVLDTQSGRLMVLRD